MATSAPAVSSKPEYQHFVPQFMLRNFAHKYTGPQRSGKGGKGKKQKKDTLFRGELVVNNVDLKVDPIAIEEAKVSRILGQYDMYQDTAQPTGQQRQIETMFGKLENHVSTIFRKVTKAFEAGDPNVWVTREERNSIRKFLFILKYRGTTFHQRFSHESVAEYDSNDKSRLQAYMEKNGFKRPLDVWFHGLKTILNLKMDTENWKEELVENMYRDDAMWFIMHSEMMYMALCTPSEPGTEFVLTSNSYNVFEGPNTFVQNAATGAVEESGWTSFHEFAPLSPKLMIILRSNLLPVPEEDSNPEILASREAMRKAAVDDWYGTSQQSALADLPIHKPRNNYSQMVNGRLQPLAGYDGSKLKSHKFCFPFFPTDKEHVHKINSILLDNAYRGTNIVFGSRDVFFKILEAYITLPSTSSKIVVEGSRDEQRKLLLNLAALLKSLGSTREPVWTESKAQVMSEFDKMNALKRSLQRGLADWLLQAHEEQRSNPQPILGPKFVYMSLGGSDRTLLEDMDYAKRMLDRRIKIDVNSQGMPETIRERNRENLIDEYLTYPSRRVLLFVKRVRLMILSRNNEAYLQRQMEGSLSRSEDPEDIIAQILHDKMALEKLNRLMYKTAMNDIDRAKDPIPENELWKTPSPSLEGALRLGVIGKFVFDLPGTLTECGIPEVERLALNLDASIQQLDISMVRGLPYPFLEDDLKIELLTRVLVKHKFQEIMADSVEESLLPKLEDVLFKTSYPTPLIKPPV
ncbi:hypothetical protein F4802DRAFT_596183 [Xylaria palmicola]|nr:hypothetical protein F4802DRAFT_596183 [Xylaria palmicola]